MIERFPASTLWLELGVAAGGLAELLACRVAVAERVCLPGPQNSGQVLLPLLIVFGALGIWLHLRDRKASGTLTRAARALLPLFFFLPVLLHARIIGGASPYWLAVLAPLPAGAAAARLMGALATRSCRDRSRWLWLILVWLGSFGLAWTLGAHALELFDGFALGHWDAGEHAARFENSLRGQFLTSAAGPTFWDHFNPAVSLLIPLYALTRDCFPGTQFCIVLQALLLALSVPLAYGLARQILGDARSAALATLAYVLAPAFTHLNVSFSYGYHSVTLALPLLLAACWAFHASKTRLLLLLLVLICSVEETLAPATFGLGLGLCLDPKWRRLGVLVLCASLGYFLLVTQALIPFLTGSPYYCASYFGHLGEGVVGVALSPFQRPGVLAHTLFDPASLAYLATLMVPWLLFPLLRLRWFIACVPVLLAVCLRENPHLKSIAIHHHTHVLAFIYAGSLWGCRSPVAARLLGLRCRGRALRRALTSGVCAAALIAALLYGDAPLGRARRPFIPRPGLGKLATELLTALPPGVSIAATERAAAHVVQTHPQVKVLRAELPAETSWFLLDIEDIWGLLPTPRLRRHLRDLKAQGYGVVRSQDPLILLARDFEPRGSALGQPSRPSTPDTARLLIGPRSFPQAGLRLLRCELLEAQRTRWTWVVEQSTEGDWGLVVFGSEGIAAPVRALGPPHKPTYERAVGEEFQTELLLFGDPKESLRLVLFDLLELDRQGKSVQEALGGLLQQEAMKRRRKEG